MADQDTTETRPGPLPPTYFLICWLGGVALHFLAPLYQLIPWPIRWAGLIPFLLGCSITIWADQIFKQRGTTVKPHLDPSELVTSGPYRISRNPMYLGMTAILLGLSVFLGSLTVFAAPAAFALIAQLKFIPIEERALTKVFGEQYRVYKQRVRAWL